MKIKFKKFAFLIFNFAFLISSCGYHLIGSKPLPFNSVTIMRVQNNTYEPRLEERLHNALSEGFIAQGIKVMIKGGDVALKATVTRFELSPLSAIEGRVQEQAIVMRVDVKITSNGKVIKFAAVEPGIRVTYSTTGSVSESIVEKERAVGKVCRKIAKEIINKIIIMYAE